MISNEAYVVDLLQNAGAISPEDLAACQQEAAINGLSTLEGIIKRGLLTRNQILEFVAKESGFEFAASIEQVDEDVLATIPPGESRRYHALPIQRLPAGLRVAIPDPMDFETLDALR